MTRSRSCFQSIAHKVRAASAVFALIVASACDTAVTTPPPRLKGPQDSVAAGPINAHGDPSYLFVAGSEANAVYAVELQSLIFVTGPGKLFPLEIPTCRSPSALAATADNAFVVVSCASDNAVQIIDTTSLLRVRDAQGVPVTAAVGQGSERLLRLPPQPDLNDHFISVNSFAQTITFFHLERPTVTTTAGAPSAGPPTSIVVDRTLPVAATIARGVLSGDGTLLFTADPTSHFVHRIDLVTGAITNFDAHGPTVDVALTHNGSFIYAATPATESITVIDAKGGSLVDANPDYAPLLPDGSDFTSVYLGEIPRRIQTVEVQGQSLELTCSTGNFDALPSPTTFALVGTETGPVYYVDIAANRLVNTSDCQAPTVLPTNVTDTALFTAVFPFTECDSALVRRLPCDGKSGVTFYPGHTQTQRVVLDYEAVLPNANRTNGGGTLVDDHTIRDLSNNYTNALGTNVGVQVGDRLIITTPPNVTPATCRANYGGENDTSLREFAVSGVTSDGSITIDGSINTDCFPFGPLQSGLLGYELRIGKGFLITQAPPTQDQQLVGRVGIGETFGGDNLELVRFTISSTQAFARDEVVDFTVTDTFIPLRAALTTPDITTQLPFPAGRVPSSITVTNSGYDSTHAYRAFVTYSATDTVAVWQAFSSADADNSGYTLVLQ